MAGGLVSDRGGSQSGGTLEPGSGGELAVGGGGDAGSANTPLSCAAFTLGALPLVSTAHYARELAIGDFDADGKPDVSSVEFDEDLTVLWGNSNGTFALPQAYAGATQQHAIVASDFNRDGYADLAVANCSAMRTAPSPTPPITRSTARSACYSAI